MQRLLLSVSIFLVFARNIYPNSPEPTPEFIGKQLRDYCKACHAVGNLRFINSNVDLEVWNYIFSNKVPHSELLWAESIIKLLSWPSDMAPGQDERASDGKRWMPLGNIRNQFAIERYDAISLRQAIVERIKKELN